MIIGWFTVILAVLALFPSLMPGAVSLFGLLLSLIALLLSTLSVKKGTTVFFKITMVTTAIVILLVNDTLRLWGAIETPILIKVFLYIMIFIAYVLSVMIVKKTQAKPKNKLEHGASS